MIPISKRAYDPRIRQAICASGNPNLSAKLQTPRSTALSWIRRGRPEVVTLNETDEQVTGLQQRVQKLERRVEVLIAVMRLLLAMRRLSGFRFDGGEFPMGPARRLCSARC